MAPWAALSGRLGLAENLPLRREPIFKRRSILAPSFTIELIGSFFDHAQEVIAGRQRPQKQALVTLEGGAPSAPQEEMAELDAWYVFGMDKADNRLEVRPCVA